MPHRHTHRQPTVSLVQIGLDLCQVEKKNYGIIYTDFFVHSNIYHWETPREMEELSWSDDWKKSVSSNQKE